MLTYRATSPARPQEAWSLIARPSRWHEWAPHVRGAHSLGEPEVEAGRSGSVRLLGLVPVPARIVAKEDGRSWTWQVGPVLMHHRVMSDHPRDTGCVVAVDLEASAPLEAILRVTYGPLTQALVGNLARVASQA